MKIVKNENLEEHLLEIWRGKTLRGLQLAIVRLADKHFGKRRYRIKHDCSIAGFYAVNNDGVTIGLSLEG